MDGKILIVGAGRMGGALMEGWRLCGGPSAEDILIRDPSPGPDALKAVDRGAALNPDGAAVSQARIVVLAVKPQIWTLAASELAPGLAADAVVVSIAAGVRSADLEALFKREVARVMPTTAVAIGQGAATVYTTSSRARAAARRLFAPVAKIVDVEDEGLVDVATAVSGSAPAYLYALIEALERAGVKRGLEVDAAAALVRRTLIGAARLLDASGEDPAELRRQVTSKGGTTQAALAILGRDGGLDDLVDAAVQAAVDRAQALAR